MHDILKKIIENKKIEIIKQKKERPYSELYGLIKGTNSKGTFSKALVNSKTVAIIAEIKKASPSAGQLRANFEPMSLAIEFQKNGAAAISVLTDDKFFHGNLKHLELVRKKVNIPLLRKDFIIDPYQVLQARVVGANAILLIIKILSDGQCNELKTTAGEVGIECLVEVHSSEELEKALNFDFDIIGINNRNLETFEVDLKTTESLAALIPEDVITVSESGIKSKEDIEKLGEFGIDAVLLGEHLMRRARVGQALRQLIGVHKWSK